jgi:hypothetical protein
LMCWWRPSIRTVRPAGRIAKMTGQDDWQSHEDNDL